MKKIAKLSEGGKFPITDWNDVIMKMKELVRYIDAVPETPKIQVPEYKYELVILDGLLHPLIYLTESEWKTIELFAVVGENTQLRNVYRLNSIVFKVKEL